MISFQPTDEQESIRQTVRDFAAQVMRPAARAYDEACAIPESFLAQAWELGLISTQIPEAYGGYGAPRSPLTNALVLEELGHGCASLALAALCIARRVAAPSTAGARGEIRAHLFHARPWLVRRAPAL